MSDLTLTCTETPLTFSQNKTRFVTLIGFPLILDLNFDHLPHYIDRHHFVQQQHNVQPPTGALEVGMTFNEKTQCIRAVKKYNIKHYFDCRTIYSNQRRLNFVCKLHENGCTWSLGACNSNRHNKYRK